jgi:hypothetical protein
MALDNVDQWIARIMEARKKAKSKAALQSAISAKIQLLGPPQSYPLLSFSFKNLWWWWLSLAQQKQLLDQLYHHRGDKSRRVALTSFSLALPRLKPEFKCLSFLHLSLKFLLMENNFQRFDNMQMRKPRKYQASKFAEGRLKLSTACTECHKRKQKVCPLETESFEKILSGEEV